MALSVLGDVGLYSGKYQGSTVNDLINILVFLFYSIYISNVRNWLIAVAKSFFGFEDVTVTGVML